MNAQAFTLYDMFQHNAATRADRPALIHDEGQLTFSGLLERVDALATGLAALGIAKGDRICILAQNHLSYFELYGACAKLGLIAYPINWRLTAAEAERILKRAEPCMLVIDETTRELVSELRSRHTAIPHWYRFGSTAADGFNSFDAFYDTDGPPVSPAAEPDDAFAVVSTAAVDIIPRGAVLTHNNFIAANL